MNTKRNRSVLETYNFDGRLFRHPHASEIKWSSYYGHQGGGFGSLTWREDRPIDRDYDDLGFWYRVIVRKGLRKILFDGFITKIEPVSDGRGEHFVITSLGWGTVFEDDTYNRIFADARPGEWAASEDESGTFQPDKFDTATNQYLYLKPRRSCDFLANEYTRLRYTFGFGETPEWIAFNYDLALPNTWPGKLEVRDSVGVLWSAAATGTGSQTLNLNAGASWVEVRFYVTAAGENTAADDTVCGKLTDVRISSCEETTITITEVLTDLLSARLISRGLSADTSRIAAINKALPSTVAFEADWTPLQMMEWCAQYGGENNALLAWGVELNNLRRVYLEEQDLSTVKYYVRRSSGVQAQVQGDLKKSKQKLYVVYNDEDNQVQRTADVVDSAQIARLGGYYRREAYRLNGNVSAATALEVANHVLNEDSAPIVTTSFNVTDHVYSATGRKVPIDEIQPGGIVVVSDFRAREATQDPNDYRTQWTSFQLVGVEVDLDNNTARLIPAGDRRAFEQLLAQIAAAR